MPTGPTLTGNGNTLIGRDWSRYPGAKITSGSFAGTTPGSNLLLLQPQGGVLVPGGGASFTLQLAAPEPIRIVHLQRLVNVTAVEITVGTYSAVRLTPPNVTYGADFYAALNWPLFFVLPPGITASSVSFTVFGAAPMLIGAVGACEGWQPPFDLVTGASDTIMDLSQIDMVPFGSTFVTQRPVRRRKDCATDYLPDATQDVDGTGTDYAAQAFTIAYVAGKHLPIVVVPFPNDDLNIERRAVWGLISTDQQFTNQFFGFYNTTFQVTQLI